MSLAELLTWIEQHDQWVYALMLGYALLKTGPLPMVAGFAAASGALDVMALLVVVIAGSILGAQIRFNLGRFAMPWVCRRLPKATPWLSLAGAVVQRHGVGVLLAYRFVKGSFSVIGLSAGASLMGRLKHLSFDSIGALLWAGAVIGIGYGAGSLGLNIDPRWAAYIGLGLLVVSLLVLIFAGRIIKARALTLAQSIAAHYGAAPDVFQPSPQKN
jgi:membrane-associated protein